MTDGQINGDLADGQAVLLEVVAKFADAAPEVAQKALDAMSPADRELAQKALEAGGRMGRKK